MATSFVTNFKKNFSEVIGDLCEESINEFCSPTMDVEILSRKSIDLEGRTKMKQQLFEDMCENSGDVILNDVIDSHFFSAGYENITDSLKHSLGDDHKYLKDWRHFLKTLKHNVQTAILEGKKSNTFEFKGEFPNQLEYNLVEEEGLENVGDCYYKEHTENCFLRYYFKKDTDEFVIGIRITDTYCQIIHHFNQMFESMKIAPIVLADNENKMPLVCSLTYNKWNSDTQTFINNGGHLPNDISIIHYTTIGRFSFDSDEPLGYKLYNAYITLEKDSVEMKNAIEELIKSFLNKEESVKFESQRSLKLTFHETEESEIELSNVNWWYDNDNDNKESSASVSNNDDTLNVDFNTNFAQIYKLMQNRTDGISESVKNSPQNLLEVVWVCGDSTFLVSNLNLCIERDNSTDQKYFLSVAPGTPMREDTVHIQYLFNVLLFNVQPSLNFICQTPSPYAFQSDFLKYLKEHLPLSIQQDSLKNFFKKEYNGKMDLFNNLVDFTGLVMVYLFNILIKSKLSVLPVATFMKSVYLLLEEIQSASTRDDLTNGMDSTSSIISSTGQGERKGRGRPTKKKKDPSSSTFSGNSRVKSEKKNSKHKSLNSPEVVSIAKRLKSSLVRTCTKENKQYDVDAMQVEDDNVKTKLMMDQDDMQEEDLHDEDWDRKTIVWKPKISKTELPQGACLIPDNLRKDIRKHVLKYFEEIDHHVKGKGRNEKTEKRDIHEFMMNFLNSDKLKNSQLKQSFDKEYEKRKKGPYGTPVATQMGMTQIMIRACGFKQYAPPTAPTGTYFYLKKKQGV